jgi:hypothetical protein
VFFEIQITVAQPFTAVSASRSEYPPFQKNDLLQELLVYGISIWLALQRLQVLIDLEQKVCVLLPRFFWFFWHSKTLTTGAGRVKKHTEIR